MVPVAKLITMVAKVRDGYEWYLGKKTQRVEWTEIFAIFAEVMELVAWFLDEEVDNFICQITSVIKNVWALDVFVSTAVYVIKNISKYKIYKICRTYISYIKNRRKSNEIRRIDIELEAITTSA
uniref:Uncharacterized protein n=1 Tax=Aedes albopictus TaxID=7160 RepID=A0A023EFG3_AEDAL